MSQELSKNLVCILMRSGVEIWVEADRAENLKTSIEASKQSMFVRYENQLLNTADISGIYTADVMADLTRKKNGEWKCRQAVWHQYRTKCDCAVDDWFERESKKTDQMLKSINPNAPQT
jgi:hypothetical protein